MNTEPPELNPIALAAIVAVIAIGGAIAVFSFANGDLPQVEFAIRPAATVAPTSEPRFQVVYRLVPGPQDTRVDITLTNEYGNIEQYANVRLPWSYSFSAPPGQFLSVSAQLNTPGVISCEIELDGVVQQEGNARGQHSIVECSGRYRR